MKHKKEKHICICNIQQKMVMPTKQKKKNIKKIETKEEKKNSDEINCFNKVNKPQRDKLLRINLSPFN